MCKYELKLDRDLVERFKCAARQRACQQNRDVRWREVVVEALERFLEEDADAHQPQGVVV